MEWLWIALGLILVIGVGLAVYERRKGIKMRYDHPIHRRGQTEADRQQIRTEDQIREDIFRH